MTTYYHLDRLGSVRAVTDASGTVLGRHDYRPFGEDTQPLPAPDADPARFLGQQRDGTKLDQFGARYYSMFHGRFTTTDPGHADADILRPQSWNAYSYARNNPLRFTDTSGLQVKWEHPEVTVTGVYPGLIGLLAGSGRPHDPEPWRLPAIRITFPPLPPSPQQPAPPAGPPSAPPAAPPPATLITIDSPSFSDDIEEPKGSTPNACQGYAQAFGALAYRNPALVSTGHAMVIDAQWGMGNTGSTAGFRRALTHRQGFFAVRHIVGSAGSIITTTPWAFAYQMASDIRQLWPHNPIERRVEAISEIRDNIAGAQVGLAMMYINVTDDIGGGIKYISRTLCGAQ
jgi:RHS repeat-associated protein